MKFENFSAGAKKVFRDVIHPMTNFLAQLNINPNLLTIFSFLMAFGAGVEFFRGSLRTAAIWLLLGGLFDVLDGDVARSAHRTSRFGALLDSTLDRYAEATVFIGIGYYFLKNGGASEKTLLLVAVLAFALVGSFMVSYVRARSEGLGIECGVGIMQRPERVILLAAGALVSPSALILVIFIIAIMTNYTAAQRVRFAWKRLNEDEPKLDQPRVKKK